MGKQTEKEERDEERKKGWVMKETILGGK